MAELKFTPVFHVKTRKAAEEKRKELRADATVYGWKEQSSYIQELPNGEFRVVFKQTKQFN